MKARDAHLANVLGVVALDLGTSVAAAVEDATGLTALHATALAALANYAEGSSIEVLRQAVGLSHSATVRTVDRLVALGLVERRAGALDRRRSAVHLTAAGRSVAEQVVVTRQAVLAEVVGRLPAETRAALAPAVDELAATVLGADRPDAVDYLCRMCDTQACGFPARCPVTAALARPSP